VGRGNDIGGQDKNCIQMKIVMNINRGHKSGKEPNLPCSAKSMEDYDENEGQINSSFEKRGKISSG